MTDRVTSITPTERTVVTDMGNRPDGNNIRLSICLRANGFSFSTMTMERELLAVGEGEWDTHRPMGQWPTAQKELLAQYGITPFDCKEVRLVVPTNQCVWVPERLYDAGRDRQYLGMVARVEGNTGVCHAWSECVKSYTVFAAPTELVTAFKVAMPGVEVVCQHAVLVDEILLQRSAQHPVMLMHVRDGVGDFEAMWMGQLLLSNSWVCADEGELLYHGIEVMKGLHLETPDMELAICGDVGRELYARLQHYFPNVTLYTGSPFSFSNPELQTFHSYKHVLLLN